MRVLFISNYLPYPADFGGARRIYHLIAGLAAQGHEITLLSFGSATADAKAVEGMSKVARVILVEDRLTHHPGATQSSDESAALSNKRRWQLRSLLSTQPYQYYAYYSPLMQTRINQLLVEEDFDIVQVEFSQMSYYNFDRAPEKTRLILDLHNIEYEVLGRTARTEKGLARRIYNLSEFAKFRFAERRGWRKFDVCLVTSSRDGEVIRQAWPGQHIVVVANGVDTAYFQPKTEGIEGGKISFMGIMRYYPNTDGATFFTREILPLIRHDEPDATFHIVGGHPTASINALASETAGVIVTGYVPDIRTYIADTTVFVVPLRIGGGTRLKILDAMALARPVVSTSLGCEGINVTPEKNILIGDTPAQFARQVVRLLHDQALQRELGLAGRTLVEEQYDWKIIATILTDVYNDLGAGRKKKLYA